MNTLNHETINIVEAQGRQLRSLRIALAQLQQENVALREALSVEDIDQIIQGIEHFVISGNDAVEDIWQPYIDKLKALRAALATSQKGV